MKKIFLIGFMGAGKSFTGKKLAENLSYNFIDLDELIETKANKTISEIFEEEGEAAFRKRESAALKSIKTTKTVVATGGGTPCFLDNMKWMTAQGITIYLQASVKLLAERLTGEQKKRPLIATFSPEELSIFINEKLNDRTPFYMQAPIIFQEKKDRDAAAELAKFLRGL